VYAVTGRLPPQPSHYKVALTLMWNLRPPAGSRLMDVVVAPRALVEAGGRYRLNAQYYITKQINPAIARVLQLVGADVPAWWDHAAVFLLTSFKIYLVLFPLAGVETTGRSGAIANISSCSAAERSPLTNTAVRCTCNHPPGVHSGLGWQ
jgi:hypothetical protein